MGRAMHDVELVEDAPDGGETPARRSGRRPLVLAAAVVAVAGVVAVVGQLVVERREDARLAALSGVTGVVSPLDGPARVLWEAPEDVLGGLHTRTPDGLVVGVRPSAEGPVQVVALDATTGQEAWRTDLLDGTGRGAGPEGPEPATSWSGACTALPDGAAVACLAHDGWGAIVDDEWIDVPASQTRLVVLDAHDGSLVTDLTQAAGVTVDAAPWTPPLVLDDGTVVLVEAPQDDDATVVAVHADGRRAWQAALPVGDRVNRYGVYVARFGDLVAAVSDVEVLLLDAQGREVRTVALEGRRAAAVSEHAMVLETVGDDDLEGAYTSETLGPAVVLTPDGEFEVDGLPVYVATDDGSVPGLFLTSDGDGRLQARDGDGELLWTTDERTESSALVLDGRVHVDGGAQLLTFDARTGEELWRSDATSETPVTDGRHLLALAAAPSRGVSSEVVAVDPVDGSEMWRAPAPDGSQMLVSQVGLLLAYAFSAEGTVSTLSVLGAP